MSSLVAVENDESVMAVSLRRATPDDAREVAGILTCALAEYGIAVELEGRDADIAHFGARVENDDWIAVGNGRVIGFASVRPFGEPHVAWLAKLFVERTARGRGVGLALLEAAHDAARRRENTRIGLRTRVVFRSAVRLYERAGYVRANEPALLARGELLFFRDL